MILVDSDADTELKTHANGNMFYVKSSFKDPIHQGAAQLMLNLESLFLIYVKIKIHMSQRLEEVDSH